MRLPSTTERALVRRYELCRREQGPQSDAALLIAEQLADAADDDCDWPKAKLWYERMLNPAGDPGDTHPHNFARISHALRQLCGHALREKNFPRAQEYALKDLELVSRYAGPTHASAASSLLGLADVAEASGDHPAARAWRQRLLDVLELNFGKDDPRVKSVRAKLQASP